MASQPEFVRNPTREAKDTLKDLHRKLGIALKIDDIVQVAIDSNLIPKEVLDQCTKDGLSDLCREALKEPGPGGLPYAKPISGGRNARWQQLALFSCDEAISLLKREYKGVQDDITKFNILLNHFRDRFGNQIPEFSI